LGLGVIFVTMEEKVMPVEPASQKSPVMKKFSTKDPNNWVMILGAVLVVVAGVATGWFLSGGMKSDTSESSQAAPGIEKSETEAGISDESTFTDSTEGTLVSGGIDGEGTHHLEKEGGPSQYVYLTSTVIDLEGFVGKKVVIWGETIAGSNAGWLMDVGKIKVIK